MTDEARIALLIDADNCPAAKIEVILDELAKYGVTNVRRAYGNWKSTGLKSWEEVLHEFAIQPIQQFAYTKGKNATDSAMIIDAMDLLYTQKLDAFCIASSDSDFTPLVMRIRTNGLKVYGFGEKKTPMPFVNACSKFLYLETLGAQPRTEEEAAAANVQKKSAKELKGDARLVTLLRNSVEACLEEDGWASLSAVGSHITNQASFDQRNYGYKKLGDLIEATGLFESERRGSHLFLRDKRSTKKNAG
ncbi:NYN domain-containing protein [Thauera sp. CAU 1555]|uniref:NYN domain-containing protein n=1 Tax=Thauera sedimentorum TaxID=2767595 RepID=A0ABR9B7N2_9RHOO|nr:NYN domain-containing protein [Thauera sedimentorum]MBC9071456.1 NYN domain-containing protein [Thauera sedimentorum]MBD8502375.1 NYN domain-containing protein [Thauera sedimentorum]